MSSAGIFLTEIFCLPEMFINVHFSNLVKKPALLMRRCQPTCPNGLAETAPGRRDNFCNLSRAGHLNDNLRLLSMNCLMKPHSPNAKIVTPTYAVSLCAVSRYFVREATRLFTRVSFPRACLCREQPATNLKRKFILYDRFSL